MVDQVAQLTEEEKELYDRQIRLWGLESQKRLRSARVLVVGINGLGAEIVKNIILAGVNSVTLMDSAKLTEKDALSQFLAPTDKIGQNRAEVSLGRARALNPLVKVTYEEGSLGDKPEGFLKNFDVVIATGLTHDQAIKMNNACRLNSVKFLACDVIGLFGYMIEDLLEHEYTEEVKTVKAGPIIDGKRAKPEESIETVKRTSKYPSFEDALDIDFNVDDNSAILRKLDPAYFVVKGILKFRQDHNRDPSFENGEEDFDILKSICHKIVDNSSFPKDQISDALLRAVLIEITNPSCAIMGGVVGQEVIKVISRDGPPLKNMFIFDPVKSTGTVIKVGC